ncbi:MAG: exonuclease domain-containing protein [Paracoccaceae bacterium]
MKLHRLGLRLRVFLFFAFLALAVLVAIAGGLALAYRRLGDPQALSAFVLAGAVSGFAVLGLTAWVWLLFDENVAKAIQRLAGGMLARAHADVIDEIDEAPAKYLGELAPAVRAVTGNLAATRSALAEAVDRETGHLVREKARLAALLADVPEGVLLCSGAHQLAFYNGPAVALLADAHGEPALDRSLFRFLREGPVKAAYARLREGGEGDATDLVCTTVEAGRVLSGRMRLLRLHEGEVPGPGYVLTLRDVTADLAIHAGREALLAEMVDRIRRPAANLQTVLEVAGPGPGMTEALRGEVAVLARTITELGARYDASRAAWWPKGQHRASDIVDGIVAQLGRAGIAVTAEAAPLILTCDAFQIVALAGRLAERLVRDHGAGVLSLLIAPDAEEGGALLTLGWAGDPLPVRMLEHWLDEPLEPGMSGRAVLSAHATDAWPEPGRLGRALLRLPIREARAPGGQDRPDRGAVYDFDLLTADLPDDLMASPLDRLTYVVFDTETTGLLPERGDEIVQIAGLRIVNGRRHPGESFESLVNPGRAIPASSTKVHGITEAMVAGADPIESVGHRFHRFAEGAVLVAHNAPFDMAFLKRHQAGIGARFDHPVLDTVLLSAVLFGQAERHSLDALCDRLGVVIPPDLRHTAMGDAVATAEVFLKMLSMLKGQGVETFGDVLAEMRRHRRLLEDLN